MNEHTIKIEAPATPDLVPQLSQMGERLARLEERTSNPQSDPAAAASLSLASEAHQLAAGLAERVAKLENQSEKLVQAVENETTEIAHVPPPPAIPEAPIADESTPLETPAENPGHHPWWNPLRYL